MDKPPGKKLRLIDLVVFLSGLVLVLAATSDFLPKMIKTSFEAIGTGLIAAGFVTFLIRYFEAEDKSKYIEIISTTRKAIEEEYKDKKKAKYIKIMGIALHGALEDYTTEDELLRRVITNRAVIELLFLHPSSSFVEHRAKEDDQSDIDLQSDLLKSIKLSENIYKKLLCFHKESKLDKRSGFSKAGSFQIRLLNACPHYTIFQYDNTIWWGLYTSTTKGFNSSVIEVSEINKDLYEQLRKDLQHLWSMHENNWLVKYDASCPPQFNRDLVKQLGLDS